MAEEILKKKEVINKTKQQTHKSKENKYFTPDTWNPYRLDRKTKTKTKPAGVKQSKTGERKKKRTMHNETGSRRKRRAQQNQSCY